MDILVTRYIGIKGTAILSREYEEDLKKRYPAWLVDEAKSFDDGIDEIERSDDNVINNLSSHGVKYYAPYTEFGVFEALFRMAKTLKCGMDVKIKDIPIKQETVEVCEHTGADPYLLYSGGSFVIACEDSSKIIKELEENDIPAFLIGNTTFTNDKVIINEDERGFLPHVRKDELKRILGRKVYYERTDIIRD